MTNYTIRSVPYGWAIPIPPDGYKYVNIDINNISYNYSDVLLNTNLSPKEERDGEFIVFNAPSSIPARKIYLEIIRMAETRNIEKSNGISDGYITIADIAKIVSDVNKSPMRISHGRVFLQITGSKITDILPGKIECWYKFPTDNAYMVICKSRPNLIEIMPGDMKFDKEVVDEDVDNQTTD